MGFNTYTIPATSARSAKKWSVTLPISMKTFFCFNLGHMVYKHSSYCELNIVEYTTTTISLDQYNTNTETSEKNRGWVSYYGT